MGVVTHEQQGEYRARGFVLESFLSRVPAWCGATPVTKVARVPLRERALAVVTRLRLSLLAPSMP